MSRIIVISLFFLLPYVIRGQNLIGYHSNDIKKIMRETQNELRLNDNTKNEYFNYLKFENNLNTKTLLCFLSDNDSCTYTKLICDYSEQKEILKMLNENYKKVSESNWIEEKDGEKYTINLKKEKWYFTIVTRKNRP